MNLRFLSKSVNRWVLTLVVVTIAMMGGTLIYGLSRSGKPSPLSEVANAESKPAERPITALGRLEPVTEVIQVSVPANFSNDQVAELRVQRGDQVEAGQIIALMNSYNRLRGILLENRAQIEIAEAELARVKAGAQTGEIAAQDAEILRLQQELEGEIDSRQATVERWQAEVRNAEAEYRRYVVLEEAGAISASELGQKELTLETAQTQLNEAQAQQGQRIDTLQEQIRQAQARLNQIAEVRPVDVQVAQAEVNRAIAAEQRAAIDLEEAYIRTPIAGRILEIYAKPGEVVGVNGIAELGQTEQMQVVAEVDQTAIDQIREGQAVIVTSNAFTGELQGTVQQLGLQVIRQGVTSGEAGENLDRKVIEVRIQLDSDSSFRVANLTNLQVQVAIQTDSRVSNESDRSSSESK